MANEKLKDTLNRANPNTLADVLRALKFGTLLASLTALLVKKAPVADAAQDATLEAIIPGAKAGTILRAYARSTSAAGTLGEMTVKGYGVTPGDGEIAVAPNGDIVVLAASAYTAIDVLYAPHPGELVTLKDVKVASNVATIPEPYKSRGAVYVVDATATAGTSTGRKQIMTPGTTVAAGEAALNAAKTGVAFKNTDAVTLCDLVLWCAPEVDVQAALDGDSAFI